MYDIRQFKPALYTLILLGISGFALAGQLLGLWLLAVGLILLNAWLLATGRFKPMARWLANVITLLSVLYVARELVASVMTPVIVIGEFLVFLQLVKLWEQRGNRDYAQLLILSLLLMVAASMNTASLLFGLLLVTYLFLSLYCCLLFHLKVETDAARAAMPVPQDKVGPGMLRQDQRFLSRSMRRLTGLVSVISLTCAVLVFLFFPRGAGGGLLGPMQTFRSAGLSMGFSGQVSFQDVARISQSHETVAFVKVWHNEQPVQPGAPLLLRGLTLDMYHPPLRRGGPWDWTRSIGPAGAWTALPGDPLILSKAQGERWRMQVSLWPSHSDVLFALASPTQFTPRIPLKIRYSPADGALQTLAPLNERIDYEVLCTNDLGPGEAPPAQPTAASALRQQFPRIYDFARRPEVTGSNARGSLADQRITQGNVSPLDGEIAANIESYFRSHFAYTLDLTDEKSVRGRDPLVAFLYDWKKGHCEYFAGAMTLMCQTLGMQARMVVGFRCDGEDYNSLNSTYTVRDSNAHAWVEVKTPQGWKSYDPTSSMDAESSNRSGLLGRLRHLTEYLEYTYANAIIAYDAQNRDNVIATLETGLATAASHGAGTMDRLHQFLESSAGFWNASTAILSGFMLLMILIVAGALGWFVWERWQLRRRAERIGIDALPESEQFRLARQLGFYDDLLQLLGHHRIVRPAHCTPLEFSRSLTFLPTEAYQTVQRLTELFYKVRYGDSVLPAPRQRRLRNVLVRLSDELARKPTPQPAPESAEAR